LYSHFYVPKAENILFFSSYASNKFSRQRYNVIFYWLIIKVFRRKVDYNYQKSIEKVILTMEANTVNNEERDVVTYITTYNVVCTTCMSIWACTVTLIFITYHHLWSSIPLFVLKTWRNNKIKWPIHKIIINTVLLQGNVQLYRSIISK
jgi:hypothetical protein